MNVSRINEGSSVVLLEMDPVFLYNIPNKSVEHIHRASDWNISAPDWYGKLLVTETDSDSCQVQFKNTNGMFGVAVITKMEFSSSQVFQKVKDSSRYCTVQIQNIVSGDSVVYGIGFMDRKDMSILFRCLQDYFGSQNESLVAEDKFFKYNDDAHGKPDVADGSTQEIEYNDHMKVKGDVINEATKDVKCTGHESIKLDVKEEITKDLKYTGHAPMKVDVKDEITKDVKYTAHAPIKVDVKDEVPKDVKYTADAPIKMDVKDEIAKDIKYTAHAPIKVDVKDEVLKDVKYTADAPIKMDVKDEITKDMKYTADATIKVDVKDEITNDMKYAAHAPIKKDVKDEITEDMKYTAHALITNDVKEVSLAGNQSIKVDVKGETTKDVKIGQSNEIKYSECKKIKRDTKIKDTNKNVTHQETLPMKANIQDAEICETPNSKEPANEISKNRKLQSDSESDEDQIKVNKSPLNSVTEEEDEAMDPQSDINDNGFLYQDSVTKSFTCHLCSYTSEFRSKMNFLLIHWASKHKIKKPITCKLCNLVFLTPEIRSKHIISRHEKMCSFCAMEFDTKKKLQNHVKLHDLNVNNYNNIKGPEPEPASTQAMHDQDVNNRNNTKCPYPVSVPAIHESRVAPSITPTVLKPPTSVQEEITEEGIPYYDRDAKLFMCNFCPLLTFPTTNHLTFLFQHWKAVHNIIEPHTCELCYLNFSKAEHRLKHVTTLHQVCSICSKEFGRLTDLTKHVSVHHWNVSNPSISVIEPKKAIRIHTCTICFKQFETEKYLRSHCEAHHGSATEQPAEKCLVDREEHRAKEQANEISKKRKLQSESQSDEDQVVVKKGISNIVTEESDITDNGHLYKDSVTNSFACHLCPYTCKIQSKVNFLLSHWASSHKIKKPIICKLCNLVFPTPEIRAKHIILRHKKMCSFCEMEFATKIKLQSHIKDLHALNVNNFNNMKKPEEPKPAATQAIQNQGVNDRNNINCPDPAIHESRVAPSITPTVHNTPMFVHGETGISYQCPYTKRFTCILCPFLKFPPNRKLAFLYQHWQEVHSVIEPHTCQLCCLNFSTAAHRLKHVTELHQVCPICSKEFGNFVNLHKHVLVHRWHASNPSISSTTEQLAIRNVSNPSTTVEPKRPTLSNKCRICSLEFPTELCLRFHSEVHGWKIA